MRFSKKLIDWITKTVLETRGASFRYNINYANSLMKRVDRLIEEEYALNLPGGTTYSWHIKHSLMSVRFAIMNGTLSTDLIGDRLDQLSDRIDEATELFKRGR